METAVAFVAQYVGFSGTLPTPLASGGLALAARHVVANSGDGATAQALLPQTPEIRAQIDEWLTWATTELTPLVDDKLFKLNDHLEARTFLTGRSITLADLVVFGVVQPAAVAFPAAQTLHFASLLRWCDLIQHLAGPAANVFPKQLVVVKPRFQPSAPLPLPAPKAGPASASVPAATAAPKSDAPKPASAKAAPAPAAAATAAVAAPAAPAGGRVGKKDKDAKKEAAAPDSSKKADGAKKSESSGKKEDEEPHIGLLDIRVGTIVNVDKHPNAEKLYLEEIDLGEDKPRQVISGLVEFVPVEKMQGRRVLVVCNLKPQKMREIMSYGMVLCASNEGHTLVDPVSPPEGVPNGERIAFEGFPGPPLEEINAKKKILEKLLPDMKTDSGSTPNYKGAVFMTSKGPVLATIPNAHVA